MLGLSKHLTSSVIVALICATAASLLLKVFQLNREVNPETFADVLIVSNTQKSVMQKLTKLLYLVVLWIVAVVLFVLTLVLDRKWLATKYVAPLVFIMLAVDFYLIYTL